MKELLEYIVKSIVNTPDAVEIEEKESIDFPGLTILTINVAEEDKGVVIGKKGKTINAIRDLITINAIRTNRRVKVLIKDDGREEKRNNQSTDVDENIFEDEI
ncbi:MAG TPA: KH domain-containing protein [Candidatus Pacearchaeota archaeon]|nr:KH domain-containing protein [Candidatus Pacearchaeota archaeon]